MDVVRYADTAGDNADYPIPEMYLYRDYIIDAFNADKPYDQFVQEQLAGDILAKQGINIETLVQKYDESTNGQVPIILMTHPTTEGQMNKAIEHMHQLDDVISSVVRIRVEQLN